MKKGLHCCKPLYVWRAEQDESGHWSKAAGPRWLDLPSTHRRQRFRVGGVDAGGMTKPSSANAGSTGRIRRDVEHDIVRTRCIAAHTGRDVIQFEIIADAPADVVVGA